LKPKLAILHYTAAPVVGGVETVIAGQAKHLRRAGYDVRVVAGRGGGTLVPEMDSCHVEVTRSLQTGCAGEIAQAARQRLTRRLGEELRMVLADRDVVIVHNVMTMPFNPALTAAIEQLSQPVIAWTHDLDFGDQAPTAAVRDDITYVAISRARQRELAQALKIPRERICYVPNGVGRFDLSGIGDQTLELLQGAGIADADPLLLVPQRVTPRKRIELVIDAAHELAQDFPQLAIVVTGPPDPHQPWVAEYADGLLERRHRLGLDAVVRFLFESCADDEGAALTDEYPVGPGEVADLYRISDVALMPSESEGFGLPILETAMSRLPLVCSDIPVLREIGGHSLYTFPTDAGPSELAQAIRRALRSSPVRRRREVLRKYGWPRVIEKTEAVISAAWNRAAAPGDIASGAVAS
jgi:glycosyltransferase involved in cell wall biosynthesis